MKKNLYVFLILFSIFLTTLDCSVYASEQNRMVSNSDNLLPEKIGFEKKSNGVYFSYLNGGYSISGVPSKSSYIELCGSTKDVPEWMKEGTVLNIEFNSETNYISFGIRAFSKNYPDGKWLVKTTNDTQFVVPDLSEYEGVSIRILVTKTDRNFDTYVKPVVTAGQIENDNLLIGLDGLKKKTNGVIYEGVGEKYYISGTPTKSSYLELCGSQTSIPEWLVEGESLDIKFNSGTNFVSIGIRVFNEDYPDGKWIVKTSSETQLVVPDLSEYTGVAIRILVTKIDRNLDLEVKPVISRKNNEGENLIPQISREKWSNGVSFLYTNETCQITGVPIKSSYLELCGSQTSIPKWLVEGAALNLSIDSRTNYVTLGIRGFNEEYPDGKWLVKTSSETQFIVPDLSKYTGISIRILVSKTNTKLNLDICPKITKVEKKYDFSYLTIIDDDGDIHFLDDIVPLIQELDVPISTAVTTMRIGSAKRWMDWEDIEMCHQAGAEILCHTYSHPTGTGILSMDDATIIANYQKAHDELERRGYSGADILVYSSSTGNIKRVQEAASKVFKCGIKIGGSMVNEESSNKFALARYRIDYASTEGRNDWDYEDMKDFIDTVVTEGGWEIWMIHTSSAAYRQRVEVDKQGNVVLDKSGKPIPMVDANGSPVLDVDGTYLTMGDVVYVPMLKNAILYAQSQGVQIVTAEFGYNELYGNVE